MRTRFVVPVLAISLTLLVDSTVPAQSLFGGRGPISGTTGTQRPFSPGTSQGEFSPVPGGGSAASASPSRFVGRSNPGDRFIGARQSTPQGGESLTSRRSGPPRASGSRVNAAETPEGSAENLRAAGSSRHPVRARERVAFTYTVPPPAAIEAALAAQFAALAGRYPAFGDVDAHTTAAGQVTLRGQVPSDDDRRLIELIVRLQPGVRSVHSEMTIAPATTGQLDKSNLP